MSHLGAKLMNGDSIDASSKSSGTNSIAIIGATGRYLEV